MSRGRSAFGNEQVANAFPRASSGNSNQQLTARSAATKKGRRAVASAVGVVVDALESRRMLTSIIDASNNLIVDGTAGADTVTFTIDTINNQVTVNLNGASDGTFDLAAINSVQVNGGDGDDSLSLEGILVSSSIDGGAGADTITGGLGLDTLIGGEGDDSFISNDGQADTLDGGNGNDSAVADNTLDSFTSIENGIPLPGPHLVVTTSGTPVIDGTTAIDFGTVDQNSGGPSRTFLVVNNGADSMSLGALQLPAGYSIVDDLVTTLGPGESDTFTIRLVTTTAGTFAGDISFANTDPTQNPFNFSVTGTVQAIPAPIIVVTQARPSANIDNGNSTVEFGNKSIGTTGPTRTFRVRNDGNATLNLGDVVAPAGFTIIDPLIGPLAPGASESFVVQVDTTTAGGKDGFVTFTTDDPIRGNFSFRVQANVGVGTLPIPEITLKSVQAKGNLRGVISGLSAFSFGTVNKGAAQPTRTFRISNDGDATLALGAVSVPSGFVILDNIPSTLKSGATDLLVIGLNTATVGSRSGNVTFTTNDSDENPYHFAVSGAIQNPPPPPPPGAGPTPTATLAGGVLTVNGTPGIDTISFGQSSKGITVIANSKTLAGSPFKSVGKIVVNAGDGDDRIILGTGISVPASIIGGNGNDTIVGGDANDTIYGNNGNDNIDGGNGNDAIWGGSNNDVLTGGMGVDVIRGEDGNDTIFGADGLADTLLDGGTGSNVIHKDRTDNATNG